MSGHTLWKFIKNQGITDDPAISYVRGYILALEDVLSDLDTLSTEERQEDDGFNAVESMTHTANESLASARRTLEALTK